MTMLRRPITLPARAPARTIVPGGVHFMVGDMFALKADVTVIPVNCVGAMGRGVALEAKLRFPGLFKSYQDACNRKMLVPGTLHIWSNSAGGQVVCLPTKLHWKTPSTYEYIETGLHALQKHLSTLGPVRVALPALGCGLGGLKWSNVSVMILNKLSDIEAKTHAFLPANVCIDAPEYHEIF